ncbi:MAG: S8 family peptidase [Elusimicrobia bacterium]|nr:S8 family peptidase [Elusimicrobiota bacterium]
MFKRFKMVQKKRYFFSLLNLLILLNVLNLSHAGHVPDEILIKWINPPQTSTWTIPGSGIEITRVKSVGYSGWELWKTTDGGVVDPALPSVAHYASLSAASGPPGAPGAISDPAIEAYGTNDYRYPLGRVPNDSLVASQYYLDSIRAFGGWEFEVGSSSAVTIAIIDTGVAIDHVDLSSATGKIWTNPVDVAGGGDQDGNGRVDDFWGWDFANNDNNPSDCLGHGTLVASVAGASADNGIGIAGTNWGAKILPLKVFSDGVCGTALTGDIIEAIDYAVDVSTRHASYTGRVVINMSLGCEEGPLCPENAAEKDTVGRALANNVLVVAAKGNFGNSSRVFPSDYPGVIGVGATDRNDNLASFSSFGSGVDLVAPGFDILGANKNGGFGNASDDGTSFSAPQVAGAAGLVLAMLPSATTAQVQSYLFGGADDLGGSGRDDLFGYGRLNLLKTMRLARYGTLASFEGTGAAIAVPNPYKASSASRVTFTIPDNQVGANPRVQIYDLSGSLIRDIEGSSWDGKNDSGYAVATGVYIFEVKTDKGKARGRVIVDAGN